MIRHTLENAIKENRLQHEAVIGIRESIYGLAVADLTDLLPEYRYTPLVVVLQHSDCQWHDETVEHTGDCFTVRFQPMNVHEILQWRDFPVPRKFDGEHGDFWYFEEIREIGPLVTWTDDREVPA